MPFINNDFINDLPNKVDIVTLINKRVPLTKKGNNYKACCPFHQEKTPSFSVSSEKQLYYCFGCGSGGGAIRFIQKFDNLDYIQAVERLAEEFGITVVYDNKNVKPVNKNLTRLRDLSQQVSKFYQAQLRNSAFKNKVIEYAKSRGISGEIAKRFELGFAPAGWGSFLDKDFITSDDIRQDLLTLGLLIKQSNKDNQYYDRFNNRLIFPIHNVKGQVIAFGGRALSSDMSKYLNSSESPIFNKSNELYGLYLARKHTKSLNYLLVVEGYMDVIALHQNNITSVVATLGTATTEQHLQILKRSTDNIIFCFDGDEAGLKAAVKALNVSLPIISANLSIKFLFLPEGEDPDSMIKKESKDKFIKRIENATVLSNFLFSHIKEKLDINTIEGKTQFLQNAMNFINKINYKTYQEQLKQGLAIEIGQSIEIIDKLIDKNPVKKITYSENILPLTQDNSQIKHYIDKLTAIILSCPSLANSKLLAYIKEIPQTQILQEIIKSIAFIDNVDTDTLINAFKKQNDIYYYLQNLAQNSVSFSPDSATIELDNVIKQIDNYNFKQQQYQQIANANNLTQQEQVELLKAINIKKKPSS